MKKIISLVTLLPIIVISLVGIGFFSKEIRAQNTGSLRTTVSVPGFSFKKDLMFGDTDPDVKELQKILNNSMDTIVSSSGAGSSGQESTYFGSLTKAAVIKFQEKHKSDILTPSNLTTGNGIVGLATRSKLNSLLGVPQTYASVGLPQSRASSVSAPVAYVTVTPTTVVNSIPQPQMSTCQFVEMLITIGVITPDKVERARSALSCGTVTPFVDLRVNGQNGPITVNPNSSVNISWTSAGVISCNSSQSDKPVSGSDNITIGSLSQMFMITCKTVGGLSVFDSVFVVASSYLGAVLTPTSTSTSTSTLNNNSGIISVDLKINFLSNYISYSKSSTDKYTISWAAENATNCVGSSVPSLAGWNNMPKNPYGSESISIPRSTTFMLVCGNNISSAQSTAYFTSNLPQSATSTVLAIASSTDGWGLASSTDEWARFLALIASSTRRETPTSTRVSNISEISDETLTLDNVVTLTDPLNCVDFKKHAYFVYSFENKEQVKYIWEVGDSELVVANNQVQSKLAMPATGFKLYLILGGKTECMAYGSAKKIVRAYITTHGEGWVREQEQEAGNTVATSTEGSN